MQKRAALKNPQFFLNVGDNFYWGGIEKTCGTPMDQISFTAYHQFDQVYERVYTGPGFEGKPWLSVLGNHDWGGRVFNNGWDQQIAYTWASTRWVLPAPYWSTRAEFPDQNFSLDLFFIDSNYIDAKNSSLDSEHNLCGAEHNPPNASCSTIGGPSSIESCVHWFNALWATQQAWVEEGLAASKGDWQILVTHFPCGHEQPWYRKLHLELGLDLLVTGHRHDQELWEPLNSQNHMGGLTCFVTGGGGGISSEATPDPENTINWYGEGQYGFFDLTLNKTTVIVESINYNGTTVKATTLKH